MKHKNVEAMLIAGDVAAALTAYNRGHDDGSRWYASVVLSKAS